MFNIPFFIFLKFIRCSHGVKVLVLYSQSFFILSGFFHLVFLNI